MGNIMENVKKAQQLVQVEAAKAQEELAKSVFANWSKVCAHDLVHLLPHTYHAVCFCMLRLNCAARFYSLLCAITLTARGSILSIGWC